MSTVCPVSKHQVLEPVPRLNALWTVGLLIAGFFFWPIIAILAVDFFIRGFVNPRYSVLSRVNIALVGALKLKTRAINAGPKIFAAKIGFFFSAAIVAFVLAGLPLGSYIAFGILGLCASLEAFFGFCVGCTVYGFLRLGRRDKAGEPDNFVQQESDGSWKS